MSKRERRDHEARHAGKVSAKRRRAWLIAGLVAILLGLIGGAVLLIRSEWVVANHAQIIGVVGLVVLAALLSLPIVIEFNRHPRHLSGPGKNPEQGPGPWDIGSG